MKLGKLWTEYWIDCARCEFHAPLGERSRERAIKRALHDGWAMFRGKWYCRNCTHLAQGIEAEGRDPKGLGAEHESPVGKADAP